MDLREEVCRVNRDLPAAGLVTMHSGNASALDRSTGRVYIKPSGLDYDTLMPEDIVEIDVATGQPIHTHRRPSVDLVHHLYLYRRMPDVTGIVHTHSNFATAFAALGREIPCVLTAIADEFGGPIPCAPFATNTDEAIGASILAARGTGPAILLERHGVFAWGQNLAAAFKAAVMVEDVAKSVWLAMRMGVPEPLPPDEIARWRGRYTTQYGQP